MNKSESENYYTIDEVVKIIGVEQYYIIFWCHKFMDLLSVKSIGMYTIFTESDLKTLKNIKILMSDKNMNSTEARKYLNGNNNHPIFDRIYKLLTIQNNKIEKIINSQNKILKNQEEIKKMIVDKDSEVSKRNEDKCRDILNDDEFWDGVFK